MAIGTRAHIARLLNHELVRYASPFVCLGNELLCSSFTSLHGIRACHSELGFASERADPDMASLLPIAGRWEHKLCLLRLSDCEYRILWIWQLVKRHHVDTVDDIVVIL